MQESNEALVELTVFLTNLSAETARLGHVAQHIDHMLGELAASDQVFAQSLSPEFQDVDALWQALMAVSQITLNVVKNMPQGLDIRLSKAALATDVKLEKVREACLNAAGAISMPSAQNREQQSRLEIQSFLEEF